MGFCLSCLREDSEDYQQNDETTPLLQDSSNANTLYKTDEPTAKIDRERLLNEIVVVAGQNLIDVTTVTQSESPISGRSAADYKRILSSHSSIDHETLTSVVPRFLSTCDEKWLNDLVVSANEAINNEPVVQAAGSLVTTFKG